METRVRSGGALLGLTLFGLLALSHPASGAKLTAAVDGGMPADPTVFHPSVSPGVAEIYLNLDGPPSEVASVFEGTFQVVLSGFVWDGFTTPTLGWGPCESGTTSSSVTVSCTSGNAGGERLVGSFNFTRTGSDPSDFFSVVWDTGFAAKDLDEAPFIMDVPISTAQGTVLVRVPEPGTAVLLVLGLAYAARTGARRNGRVFGG